MSIEIGKLERLGYFNFAVFIISFWIFFVTKILVFIGILKFSNTLNNIEFFSFFIMVATLIIFLNSIFDRRNKKEKEILEKSNQLELKLSAIDSTNAVLEFSSDGHILSINKTFTDVFGHGEEILNKHHSILVPEHISKTKAYKNFWKDLAKGYHKFDEFERINKNGETIWITGTYVPIKNKKEEVYKVLKIAQDNTQAIKALQELEKKNTYLEHAAKILRHDMHSGINTYIPRGLKSLLRRVSPEKIKECKAEAPIKMIDEGLKHTQRVYKGVYEFTNLVKQNSTLNKESHNLEKILNEYLKPLHYSDMIKIDTLPTIEVNQWLFCTAIDNLIRNGLKYNDSKSKIIKIYAEKDYIIIEDNGRGMTKEEFELYSKPYVRNNKNKESGTGLGLNICIAIMKEHGFGIHSELNQSKPGTKIYIKIKNN